MKTLIKEAPAATLNQHLQGDIQSLILKNTTLQAENRNAKILGCNNQTPGPRNLLATQSKWLMFVDG